MSALELYEATRGVWRVGERRNGARFGLAVFDGVVLEAYRIKRWLAAGTLPYTTRRKGQLPTSGRWEFEGLVASDSIRNKYCGRSVSGYLTRGSRNPVTYVNC